MHPGPKNEGVEIARDVAAGSHSIIEQQVANGVAVRMALLTLLAHGQAAGASEASATSGTSEPRQSAS